MVLGAKPLARGQFWDVLRWKWPRPCVMSSRQWGPTDIVRFSPLSCPDPQSIQWFRKAVFTCANSKARSVYRSSTILWKQRRNTRHESMWDVLQFVLMKYVAMWLFMHRLGSSCDGYAESCRQTMGTRRSLAKIMAKQATNNSSLWKANYRQKTCSFDDLQMKHLFIWNVWLI